MFERSPSITHLSFPSPPHPSHSVFSSFDLIPLRSFILACHPPSSPHRHPSLSSLAGSSSVLTHHLVHTHIHPSIHTYIHTYISTPTIDASLLNQPKDFLDPSKPFHLSSRQYRHRPLFSWFNIHRSFLVLVACCPDQSGTSTHTFPKRIP